MNMSIVERGDAPDLYVHRHAINKQATVPLLDAMRRLLADTVTVYQHALGFHWNVNGGDFSQYHALFGSVYEDIGESVDPIAENLLKLGAAAPYTLTDMVTLRTITDAPGVPVSPEAMAAVLNDMLGGLLASLNGAFAQASAANEQGVANFLADRIDRTQKWMWQLRASLGVGPA